MTVSLIISGGQTGADMGGLRAGVILGIATGGFMPRGWRTEAGPRPDYEQLYGLTEYHNEDYIGRTRQNVTIGDATVIFGRRSIGSNRTEEYCRILQKPCLWIKHEGLKETGFRKATINSFKIWLARYDVETLNVAGNRESVSPGIEEFVEYFIRDALKL